MAKNKFLDEKRSPIYKTFEILKKSKPLKILVFLTIFYNLALAIMGGINISKGADYYKNSFLFKHNNIFLSVSLIPIALFWFYLYKYKSKNSEKD